MCTNTPGSYHCACLANYTLQSDKWSCKAKGDKPYALFVNSTNVLRIDLEGTNKIVVAASLQNATAVDFLHSEGYAYFIDKKANEIRRAKLDGSEKDSTTLILSNVKGAESISIDWLSRIIYYTDSDKKAIMQVDVDGSHPGTFLSLGSLTPGAITVDPISGYVYWVDVKSGAATIERADLADGSNRRAIKQNGLKHPFALVIDHVDRRLFYADNKKIMSMDFDGSDEKTVGGSHNPLALSEFEQHVFWTDNDNAYLNRGNKYTGLDRVTIRGQYNRPYDLHVVHALRQPLKEPEKDECAVGKGGCQQVCVNTVGSFYCDCYLGYRLNSDRKTCTSKTVLFLKEPCFDCLIFSHTELQDCGPGNGGCSHLCTPLASGYQCSCPPGFNMSSNGKDCTEIDECATGTSGCSHYCTNTIGSFRCSCPPNTNLGKDVKTCEGTTQKT